ncbi:NUDIX hydrolase [Thermoclostridium caenicola]|uniref:ADP-ribose pyrophosphatase YjhB, NUDIX family n=1 Tax=Thermoclostridium caenicola TaxID=659425 RepID=A0A1M6BGX8_9FIRM|nr:NUDIX hydrolase [Thermoclostridium caenicola]SHI48030.1 ADP-ribose pyrophosphatase YjhB, NUDIX family [Thermoclostridium caenicola]HOP73011.1 NUDIX hydrolase [Thermoclostridium caenicola]
MHLRDCAGGVVFHEESVFLLKNEKNEWVMPKGLIKNNEDPEEAALRRVFEETGIKAEIIEQAGRTYYEFYSITRQMPVCNRIAWYVMKTDSEEFRIAESEKYAEAGFFPVLDAIDRITYSQDKSLLIQSYKKYCQKTGREPQY